MLWDRLRLGLSFPLTVLQAGDGVIASGTELAADGGAQVGDLRAGADVRLLGNHGDPLTLALGMQAHLPTGSQNAMTSDGTARVAPRLLAAGEVGSFEYAGRVQFNLRPERVQFVGTALGNEVFVAAAAGRRFGQDLLLGLELFGSTTVSEGSRELFDAYNLRLSRRRAAAVMRWLVAHGVASERLSSQGFGETEPIDDNKTEEGRRNNRRVEFHIMQQQ